MDIAWSIKPSVCNNAQTTFCIFAFLMNEGRHVESPNHNHHKAASLINAIIDRVSNILTSSGVYAAATFKQMLQGKQYACAIRGVRSSVADVPNFR